MNGDELVEILADFDQEEFLRIGFHGKNKVSYGLQSKELTDKLNTCSSEVAQFVELFRKQELHPTPYELKAIANSDTVRYNAALSRGTIYVAER